jgi:tetratricopeptide (TPR) repeat protein
MPMQEQNEKTVSARRRQTLPILGLLGLLVAIAAASFLPDKRLWGINHLAYFPVPVRAGALFVMAIGFIPVVSRAIYTLLVGVHGFLREHRTAATTLVAVAAVGSIFVFGAFQSSTLLLGDGEVIANNFTVGYRGDSTVVLETLGVINKNEPISPGTTTLHYVSSVFQTRLFGAAPTEALRFFSCFLGGIFVFLMLTVVFRSSLAAPLAIWVMVLVFSSGAMLLFFGYVENYAPVFVVGTIYVILGLRFIHGKARLWSPIVAFLLAVYSHVSGVLLGASLVFLIVTRVFGGSRMLRVVTAVLVVLTCATVYLAGYYTRLGEYFLPLFPSQSSYSVLSPNHWIDIANELLLLAPALPLLVALWIVLWRGRGSTGTEGSPDEIESAPTDQPTPWLTRRDEWHFSILVLIPAMSYLLFFNPAIGLGRDWDLFTVTLFGLVPMLLLVINRTYTEGRVTPHRIVVPALIMGVVMTAAWIGVNAAPEKSTERFEHILAYQESRPDYAYEVLAKTYHDQGRLADAIRIQETASSISGNPRHYLMLAGYYREYGDIDASVQVLQRIIERRPEYRPARRELLVALFNHRRFEDVVTTAHAGMAYHPEDPFYYYYVGRGLIRLGRIDDGRAALLECQRLRPGPLLTRAIAEELRRLQIEDRGLVGE